MKLLTGDAAKQLKKIEDNSIDNISTDPPYGYSFMGKNWDKSLPDIKIWKECYRVLKPGAFMFVMAAPRQDVLYRMMMMLEEAGFIINFSSIYWSYASGFPKSLNLSKAADKRNEKEKSKVLSGAHGGFQMKPAVEIIIVVQKPLSEKSYIDQALKYVEELQNKEQFLEEYDVRNIFQDKLLECGESVEKTFPFLIVPKASKAEKNKGCEKIVNMEKLNTKLMIGKCEICGKRIVNDWGKTNRPKSSCLCENPIKTKVVENVIIPNNHPTVKPVKLFTYLITLATRKEDIVLDPFMGSGTTGIAAKMLNRQFIGIEMEEEYMKIAKARIDATETLPQYLKNKFWE